MPDKFRSAADMFLRRVAETPDRPAFGTPRGEGFHYYSWKETGDEVRQLACGLRALGLVDEDRVAILASTRVEWIFADLGILLAGGACTTIYPSNKAEECAYILDNSKSRYLFAENEDQVKKILSVREKTPALEKIIVIDGNGGHDGLVISWADLKRMGAEHDAKNPAEYEEIANKIDLDRLATLIYTSGTTGTPKGVELTHRQWVFEGYAIDALDFLTVDDVQYFWLPLSHVFGKVLEMAQLRIGFVTVVDGRVDKIIDNLAIVKPTFMAAVPRIFEKVYNKVVAGAKEKGGMTWTIFQWALGVGLRASREIQAGRQPSGILGLQYMLADRLVFSKLRTRFGGRLKVFVSGSAPLSRDMAEFFHAAGMLIIEGYGLTETSAASYVNRPKQYKFGTVGLALPGMKVKIAEADGEILLQGDGVMRGYYNLPQATNEAIVDGWFHTGDIGEVDADGFLRITDRKKDLIKTSGGKYVAPQLLEGKMKAICPYASQLLVHGDNRNFCVALVALDPEAILQWAGQNGLPTVSFADFGKLTDEEKAKVYKPITENPKTRELMQGYIDTLNKDLASYEQVKKFAILPRDLSEAEGDLTASLKLKRKVVEKKFAPLIEAFYAGQLEK